jgi:hypothetical protein
MAAWTTPPLCEGCVDRLKRSSMAGKECRACGLDRDREGRCGCGRVSRREK